MAILHDGTKVKLGGKEYILPPLTLKALRLLGPKISSLSNVSGMPTVDQVDVMVEIVLASAIRNYPELTSDDLMDLLDLDNIKQVFPAIMSASGLRRTTAEGEVTGL